MKNTVSSSRFDHVHVTLVPRKRHNRHKAKIVSIDDDRNHSRFYTTDIVHAPTWATRTLTVTNPTRSTETTNVNSGTNSSLRRQKKISNYGELTLDSNNRSHTYGVNLTCKSVLIEFSICLLGLFVIAALILPNVILYLMLPIIFQSPVNQSSMREPIIYANHCGGVSSYTRWTYYYISGIYMPIDTSNCSFNITPLYYTSITGNNLQNDLTGSSAIYGKSKNGFRIYCRSYSGWSGTKMLNYSQIEQWNVSWIGIYY